ncbi:MAG: hypothetical protein AMXMBFR64_59550 [Myxococcales bacterium]
MRLHLHRLDGCAPAPLAHYLKAVAVLRIVAEQKDPSARGFWEGDRFCLLTTLAKGELEQFFLQEYAPTAFVSPWNKGSGFYSADDKGLAPVERSTAQRFAAYRAGIEAARAPFKDLADADAAVRALKERTKARAGMTAQQCADARALKDSPEFKRELAAAERRFGAMKKDIFTPYRLAWRGAHRTWMDAAIVLMEDDKPAYPSLLGTGGNDGRLDFTNNAMQRLAELFDLGDPEAPALPATASLLRHSLFGMMTRGLQPSAIGQFLPGAAGGANSTTGADGDSLINPWDFVLMLEGTILFSGRATRRLDPGATSRASDPFAVRAHAAGYGTPGNEKSERGEQWMPLWATPASLPDLRALIGEARAQLGRQVANRPIDVARAITRLGVARGIVAFTRFGYLERNGQSNLAVPLGRIDVVERPRSRLIDDLAPWLDRLERAARDKHAPARLVHSERRLASAVFAALTHDDTTPERWQAVLLAAGVIEQIQRGGSALDVNPIPPLSPEWVAVIDDGSAEVRLALALASSAGSHRSGGRVHDPIRHHWLPLEPGARRFQIREKRLAADPRVVIGGRDPLSDAESLVGRRLLESAGRADRRLPLVPAPGCGARFSDLSLFLGGEVAPERVWALALPLMAINWTRWQRADAPGGDARGHWPEEAWLALRLALLPWPLDEQHDVRTDPAVFRRLSSGDASGAVAAALARLRAAGIRAPIRAGTADAQTARLWAAALAFPISRGAALNALHRFQNPTPGGNHG